MNLPSPETRFRGIIEYTKRTDEGYRSILIGRPYAAEPVKADDVQAVKGLNDFVLFLFRRCPLDWVMIKNIPFPELIPFVSYFKHANGELKDIERVYNHLEVPFKDFQNIEKIGLERECSPPTNQNPGYEPFIYVEEVDRYRFPTFAQAWKYATAVQTKRMFEYLTILDAFGHDPVRDEDWKNEKIDAWVERNAKVHRLANPVAPDMSGDRENPLSSQWLGIKDITRCESTPNFPHYQHYWHPVTVGVEPNTRTYTRKFYVMAYRVETPELMQQIWTIPKKQCPDALEQKVEREGKVLIAA